MIYISRDLQKFNIQVPVFKYYPFHIKDCPKQINQVYFFFAILFWLRTDRINIGRVHQKINQSQNKPSSSTFDHWSCCVAHCSRLIYNGDIFEQFRFNFRTSKLGIFGRNVLFLSWCCIYRNVTKPSCLEQSNKSVSAGHLDGHHLCQFEKIPLS